jgi:peptidoglycan/LPS O-acetylase OafA/YrhL
VSIASTLGVFSYSIYLTHELTIMQSWQWTSASLGQIANVFLFVIPAVILFAWTFFWFCERPFMRSTGNSKKQSAEEPQTTDIFRQPILLDAVDSPVPASVD